MRCIAAAVLLCPVPGIALAQGAQPLVAVPVTVGSVLPGNSEVAVILDGEVSSKRLRVGNTFPVSVARDVMAGDRVVIPRGTHGTGAVTWRTGKGAFGKSAKMEIEVRSLLLNGRTIPLTGRFREAGGGNTGATIGAVVAAGVIAGALVTGKSAVFERGRELRVFTADALPIVRAEAAVPAMVPAVVEVAPTVAIARPAVLTMAAAADVVPARVMPIAVAIAPARSAAPDDGSSPEVRRERLIRAEAGIQGRGVGPLGWTISD